MSLSSEQLAFYEENGYVLMRGIFSSSDIAEIKQIISSLTDEAKKLPIEKDGDNFQELRGSRIVLSKNSQSQPVIKRIVWAGAANKKLLEYGRNISILELASQLLQSKEADHLINQIHLKESGDEVSFPWHQDEQNRRKYDPKWKDVNKKGSFVQTLTAIDKSTLDNGPLYIIPGSHQWGYLQFGKFLQTDELQSLLKEKGITENFESTQIPLLMNPGDVVCMHPCLIHGSWPNNSKQSRQLFINGFSYPGANHRPYPGKGSGVRISLTG
jgi:ectoine hydroxylase-related dioxygenase (phytanoyl-CoA dioxygenase family)